MQRVKRKPLGSAVTARTGLLRKVLGVSQDWLKSRIYGQSQSIFDLINRVQKETDQISYRRQVMIDRFGRSRSPVGF